MLTTIINKSQLSTY